VQQEHLGQHAMLGLMFEDSSQVHDITPTLRLLHPTIALLKVPTTLNPNLEPPC
jgi:hypothetical protein